MTSITTWNRLEPVPRSADLRSGLRAELEDPLWLMGRQWQFGEFAGEDAGSPVESVLHIEVARLSRYRAGAGGGVRGTHDLDDHSLPLEAAVERRPVAGTLAEVRWRAEGGLHFLRLLRAHRVGEGQRRQWVEAYTFEEVATAGVVGDDPAGVAWLATVQGRTVDGAALADALGSHLSNDGTLTDLPAEVAVPASQRARVLAAAGEWLHWWRSGIEEPPAEIDAWDPRRLEYAFSVQTSLSDGDVVLRADDYTGGHLDWYEYEADHRGGMGAPAQPAPPRLFVRRTLPSHAFYSGMPADRFWEFEDSTVRFGMGSSGRTDLAHLLLDEFALGYGNDWFVVPITLPVDSVCAVRKLSVRDTFGGETRVGPTATAGWRMFDLSTRAGAAARVTGLMHVAARLPPGQHGDPLEEVAWFRDEMANLVWAVERRTESAAGGSVDRYERVQRGLDPGASQQAIGETGDATLVYRLKSRVPENWHPFVPVRPEGAPAGAVELELRFIDRMATDGTVSRSAPQGRFLTAATPLVVADEEVAREGRIASLRWQLSRGMDGRYHSWLSHRVETGHGEGSSGLVFDVARPIDGTTM